MTMTFHDKACEEMLVTDQVAWRAVSESR
jgi:hypothetical protein